MNEEQTNPSNLPVDPEFSAGGLHRSAPQKICNMCKVEFVELKRCTTCKIVYYCGHDCQTKDWPVHKKYCKKIGPNTKQLSLDMHKDMISHSYSIIVLWETLKLMVVSRGLLSKTSATAGHFQIDVNQVDEKQAAFIKYLAPHITNSKFLCGLKYVPWKVCLHPGYLALSFTYRVDGAKCCYIEASPSDLIKDIPPNVTKMAENMAAALNTGQKCLIIPNGRGALFCIEDHLNYRVLDYGSNISVDEPE